MPKPDYIIVGAGSCGSVVARGLLERGFHVCLLEAGESVPVSRRPADYPKLFGGPQDWSFKTASQTELSNRQLAFPRGRGPGGSTRINAMIWYPPQECDWQMLHDAGGESWSPSELGQSFQTVESWVEPEWPRWLSKSTQQTLTVCQALGLSMQPFRRMTRRSKRRTAFDLLDRGHNRSDRLDLHPAVVQRLLIDAGKTIGVEVESSSGQSESITAQRGVILCAGAIASPQLLFASGIGAKAELADCCVACHTDLPAVGKQLADHLIMPLIYQRPGERFPSGATVGDHARWEYQGTGPLASNLAEAGGVFEISGDVACQLHITPTHYLLHPSDRSPAALSLGVNLCCPKSRGQLRWRPDAQAESLQISIDPAYCTDNADRESLSSAIERARLIGRELQRRSYAGEELIPGERRKGDDHDWKSVSRFAQTLYHPCGTCRMGTDEHSVVDPRLKVRGMEQLSIIDASILPSIPSVNPNAMLMAMAYHAAWETDCFE